VGTVEADRGGGEAVTPFTVLGCQQRSPEWFAARCGRVNSSDAADMLAQIKSGEAAARRDLRTRLVVERITGQAQDSDGYVSKDMQRGIELEADAFAAYEAATGTLVRRTGFIRHDGLMIGASLDGDMDDLSRLVELKVPKSATHLGYWRGGVLPSTYRPQVTHQLYVTGAESCDFVSFDPRFPPTLQLFMVRVERSAVDLAAYELALSLFLSEVDREVEDVRKLMERAA
jgi:predicted phage-related endonuclease